MSLKKKTFISSIFSILLLFPSVAVNAGGLWSEDLWNDTPTTQTPNTSSEQPTLPYTELWTEPEYTEKWTEPKPTDQPKPTNQTDQTKEPTINPTPIPPTSPSPAINSKALITFDVQPVNEKGTTLVPLRKLFEVLGANVKFEPTTGTIAGAKGDNIILLTLDSNIAYVNGKKVTLSVSAKSVNGRTLVPLRFISEALGSDVKFDPKTQEVNIDNQFYFYVGKGNQQPSSSTSTSTQTSTSNQAFIGTWKIWVSGGYTAPDPVTGISTYTKGEAGGTMTIKKDGTFFWDMKTEQYSGTWTTDPNNNEQIILKSSDGWDYTCRFTDSNTIKWATFGLEYYGTK